MGVKTGLNPKNDCVSVGNYVGEKERGSLRTVRIGAFDKKREQELPVVHERGKGGKENRACLRNGNGDLDVTRRTWKTRNGGGSAHKGG